MKNTLIMHKIVNVCYDTDDNDVGFELDNKSVIYKCNGFWQDPDYENLVFNPILDNEHNLLGFIAEECIVVEFEE